MMTILFVMDCGSEYTENKLFVLDGCNFTCIYPPMLALVLKSVHCRGKTSLKKLNYARPAYKSTSNFTKIYWVKN